MFRSQLRTFGYELFLGRRGSVGILVERLKLPEHLFWLLFARVLDQATGLLPVGDLHWPHSQLAGWGLRLS